MPARYKGTSRRFGKAFGLAAVMAGVATWEVTMAIALRAGLAEITAIITQKGAIFQAAPVRTMIYAEHMRKIAIISSMSPPARG